MTKLIYLTLMSIDGYIGDNYYDWGDPGKDGHQFFSDLLKPVGTYLYGRKNYETMSVWGDPRFVSGLDPASQDFAKVWQAADKIIYSRTLDKVSTANTRLEKDFDPAAIRTLKQNATREIAIGGPTLAGQAIKAGLIDEVQLCVVPTVLGGGIPVLPRGSEMKLELLEEQKFGAGWVFLRYRILK